MVKDWLYIVFDYVLGTVAALAIIAVTRFMSWSVGWLEVKLPVPGQDWIYNFLKTTLSFSGVVAALLVIGIKIYHDVRKYYLKRKRDLDKVEEADADAQADS